jgi:CelD/BcsL family acetyltransferase involved in cellulose biosynthesis
MQALTIEELDAASADYDRLVAESDDLDRFCTSSDWVVPAARALMPQRRFLIRRTDLGFVALAFGQDGLEPLEAAWGLACPLVGAPAIARELGHLGESVPLVLCGLQPRTLRIAETARSLDATHDLCLGPVTRRHRASLAGGADGFLSRRSAKMRANLRRAARRAADRGVRFVEIDDFERALAVDAQTWKANEGAGVAGSGMDGFYREMSRRLARRGALRGIVARLDDRDVAYLFGGLFAGEFRGLQFGFAEGLEALSLGNLCQWEMIQRLCAEGVALYDLGTDVEYKQRWGESQLDTVTLIARPR